MQHSSSLASLKLTDVSASEELWRKRSPGPGVRLDVGPEQYEGGRDGCVSR